MSDYIANFAGGDRVVFFMVALSVLFMLEAFVLAALLFFKRKKNKKLFKSENPELEYKVSEITSSLFSSAMLAMLAFIKVRYFSDLDKALSALVPIAVIIFANIVFRVVGFFRHRGGVLGETFFNCALRSMDDFTMAVVITLGPAIVASQMPIAEMSRYFGAGVRRAVLAEFPFALACAYMLLAHLSLVAQNLVLKVRVKSRHMNEALELALFAIVSFLVARRFVPGYNLFLILMIGVISTCIISSVSQYLNSNRIGTKRKLPLAVAQLYTISNVLTSTFSGIFIMCAVIFTSLNLGGFYGMAAVSLAMMGSWPLTGSLNVIYRKSDTNKYVAKTINNVVLFYIFYEMLEFILKRQVSINIFSHNVVIGLFLAFGLVVFNILKVVNLAKYLETLRNKGYIFARSLIYMALFIVTIYLLFPFVNYELLGAIILGLVIMTSFVSLVLLNGADVLDMVVEKIGPGKNILKGTVVPLESQIATLIIVLTIIFLPAVK